MIRLLFLVLWRVVTLSRVVCGRTFNYRTAYYRTSYNFAILMFIFQKFSQNLRILVLNFGDCQRMKP